MHILIADDHPLIRESLRETVASLVPDAVVVEAADADEVRERIDAIPDLVLVLLDLCMPGSNGTDLLEVICLDHPEMRVIVCSASSDPATVRKALDIGAAGFISKASERAVLRAAIRLVLDGGIYLPTELLSGDSQARPPTERPEGRVLAGITPRQLDVLRLLGAGLSNKEIARALDLSQHTVKIHVASLLRALGVTNRTQAALVAKQRHLLDG